MCVLRLYKVGRLSCRGVPNGCARLGCPPKGEGEVLNCVATQSILYSTNLVKRVKLNIKKMFTKRSSFCSIYRGSAEQRSY